MASDWEIQNLARTVEALTAALKDFTETLREMAEPLDVIATRIEELREESKGDGLSVNQQPPSDLQ